MAAKLCNRPSFPTIERYRCMQQTRPLPDTHPELTVTHWPGFTEYRVEHYRVARDGSGRIVRGTCVWSWFDAGAVALAAFIVRAWIEAGEGRHGLPSIPFYVFLAGMGTLLLWVRCTQVLHESVLVFPTLGIQLETHRGHPLIPSLSITRHFIPLSALEDVVMHEGFRRWNVRYYLAALQRRKRPLAAALAAADVGLTQDEGDAGADISNPGGVVEVHVAFENILPYFPVLKVVYLGVQETLFPPVMRAVDADELSPLAGGLPVPP